MVFPALGMSLAFAFFVKLSGAYFDYRQRGQFEWTGPAILFAYLIFTLTAPKYIWTIIGIRKPIPLDFLLKTRYPKTKKQRNTYICAACGIEWEG